VCPCRVGEGREGGEGRGGKGREGEGRGVREGRRGEREGGRDCVRADVPMRGRGRGGKGRGDEGGSECGCPYASARTRAFCPQVTL
jgi:hypothetical protein